VSLCSKLMQFFFMLSKFKNSGMEGEGSEVQAVGRRMTGRKKSQQKTHRMTSEIRRNRLNKF